MHIKMGAVAYLGADTCDFWKKSPKIAKNRFKSIAIFSIFKDRF